MRKYMNTKLRYLIAFIFGIGGAYLAWSQITLSHPMFFQIGASGLISPISASIFGGFIVASISPRYKIRMSAIVGLIVALPLLLFLLRNGFSHYGRNPFFWYWPVYVTPFFCLGGFLGRNVWRHA